MSVGQLLDDVLAAIGTQLMPAPALIGGAEPVTAGDLPAVVLSLSEMATGHGGLGAQVGGPLTGALPTTQTVDLADPQLDLPGASVTLLSADRRTLLLPVGGLVRADGTTTPPWSAQDISVSVAGAPVLSVVMTAPGAGEVQLVPAGRLVFPAPLPATGKVIVSYYVGIWALQLVRYQALLEVEVLAADPAAVDQLSRQLDLALGGPPAQLLTVTPVAWGPIAPPDGQRADARSRVLSYRIDYERIDPVLPPASGPIVQIDATFTPPLSDALTVPEGSPNE